MLQPHEKDWLNNVISVYLECRQFAKAQPLLRLLVEMFPQDAKPLKQLAYLHYQQGEYNSAIESCERYERLSSPSTDSRMYLLKSFCYLKSGQPELARDSYRQYTELRNLA